MKTTINNFSKIFVLLTLFTFGCSESFLDYDQRGVQTADSFYQTDAQAFEAIMAVYNQWQASVGFTYLYLHEALADECYAGGGSRGDNSGILEELNEYRFTPTTSAIRSHYSWLYNCINRSNLVIDNVEPDTEKKTLFVAMAKAMRGYAYFYLVNLWGGVPIILHELSADEYNQPRNTVEEVYAQIEQDLTEAIADLPVRSEMDAEYIQLINKGTAQSMLGKTYLFEEKYDEAAAIFQKVIDSGEFDLYPDYSKVLRVDSEFGVESVWDLTFVTTMNYSWPSGESALGMWTVMLAPRPEYLPYMAYVNLDLFPYGWGFINPHKELYDAFVEAGDSVRRVSSIVGPEELDLLGGRYLTAAGNIPYGSDGYIRLKYMPFVSEGGGDGWSAFANNGTNCRMIRYADVLLMAAEAYNRSGNDGKAQTYLNMVRNRVQLDPVSSEGTALFEAIKTERRLELAFEGQRYLDLQRWGDAYEALKDQGKSIPNGSGGYYTPDGAGYKQGRNELLPIPDYEMTVNTALEGQQNPGY